MIRAAGRRATRHAFVRFLGAGIVNTGATYALYLLLLKWLDYRASYTVSFLAGILLAYELNRIFVFQAMRAARSMMAVPLIYLLQYLAGLGIVMIAVHGFGIPKSLAPIMAIAFTLPMTFMLNRWAFLGSNR